MSKCSSKLTRYSSAASIASLESLKLKSLNNTTKAKLFIEQANSQAKRKLDLIRRKRKELEEAETLNTQVVFKEQLKVVQILET